VAHLSDFSENLDLQALRDQIDKVAALIQMKELIGFHISTPFSKGYRRFEASNPDDFNGTIVEAILFLLKEHDMDGSSDKVNIEDQRNNHLIEITLFPSMVELKDLRSNETGKKYKIILETPGETAT
jgi:hypothetical protein